MSELLPNGFVHYLAGGLVIGAGVALLYVFTGWKGGMSTFFTSCCSWLSAAPFFSQSRFRDTRGWRLAYAAGLVAGAAIAVLATRGGAHFVTAVPASRLLLGGVLVGFGARLSNGCTSGHGICGLASLQLPSLLAVLTFLATGIGVARLVTFLGCTQ